MGCHLWSCTESDMTEATQQQQQQCIYVSLKGSSNLCHPTLPLCPYICPFSMSVSLFLPCRQFHLFYIQQCLSVNSKLLIYSSHLPAFLFGNHNQSTLFLSDFIFINLPSFSWSPPPQVIPILSPCHEIWITPGFELINLSVFLYHIVFFCPCIIRLAFSPGPHTCSGGSQPEDVYVFLVTP